MPTQEKARAGPKSRQSRVARASELRPQFVSNAPAAVSRMRLLTTCALLALATVIVYVRAGSHPFVDYDDPNYVINNDHVKAGLTWATLTWAFTATEAANWHPLTWLSHALDCQLFGMNPHAHHWTSILLHTLNVLLLFLLLQRATGAFWRSALVAALFALHPLNVESVAWISERKTLLSMFFFLLALGAYGWYARKPGIRRYLLLAFLFALGLAAKPMVITLPFVLLLLDLWPLRRISGSGAPSQAFPVEQRPFSKLVLEKLPLLILCAGSAVITIVAQGTAVVPGQELPLGVRLVSAPYAYGMYLWKAIWPARLALVYPHPGRSLPLWQPLLAGLVLLSISWIAWKQRRQRPYLAAGWLWFLITLVPMIGIVQVGVQVIADRYAYLPLIGIFASIVWGATELADHFKLGPVPRACAAVLVLAALFVTTWRQVGYWDSTADVWSHALQVTKDNSVAENGLAIALFDLGRYDEGIIHMRNFARLEPLIPEPHMRVAADYEDRGQFSDALREYEAALRADAIQKKAGLSGLDSGPLAIIYANMGVIYAQLDQQAKSRAYANRALETDAQALGQMMGSLAQELAAHPTAQGCLRLGLLLEQAGMIPQARQYFLQVQQLDPSMTLPSVAQAALQP